MFIRSTCKKYPVIAMTKIAYSKFSIFISNWIESGRSLKWSVGREKMDGLDRRQFASRKVFRWPSFQASFKPPNFDALDVQFIFKRPSSFWFRHHWFIFADCHLKASTLLFISNGRELWNWPLNCILRNLLKKTGPNWPIIGARNSMID